MFNSLPGVLFCEEKRQFLPPPRRELATEMGGEVGDTGVEVAVRDTTVSLAELDRVSPAMAAFLLLAEEDRSPDRFRLRLPLGYASFRSSNNNTAVPILTYEESTRG